MIDTYTKTTFVKWEVEVAIEKGCRLFGANLNNCRTKDWLCRYFFADKGALFILLITHHGGKGSCCAEPVSRHMHAGNLQARNLPGCAAWRLDLGLGSKCAPSGDLSGVAADPLSLKMAGDYSGTQNLQIVAYLMLVQIPISLIRRHVAHLNAPVRGREEIPKRPSRCN